MNNADDEVLKYLSDKNSVRVTRISEAKMQALGTTKNSCHANVYRYAAENNLLEVRHVYGWIVLDGYYLLHSVIGHQDGRFECITPSEEECGPRQFIDFIEDPHIGLRDFERDGKILTEVIRNGRDVSAKIKIPHGSRT